MTDYNYYLGSAKQASDFEQTTEYIINYIQKSYDYGIDIAMALSHGKHLNTDNWKPSIQVSIAQDDAIRESETRQFEIEFKEDYNEYKIRARAYENNLTKAYAQLWERCA